MKNSILFSILFLMTSFIYAQDARVQVIHNSADTAAEFVDVYLNDILLIPDFEFRTASPFIDAPAGVEIELSVAPAGSMGVGDAIYTVAVTLMANETYVVVADGIVSPMGYDPPEPFGLQIYSMGRETATDPTNTDVLVHHGSTDAPTVDVVETGAGAGTIVDDLAYTDFQGYLELPTADYVLEIRDETGTVGVAAFQAPLATLGLDGVALAVIASGFLDPSQNSNGPAFGLYVALPTGGDLVELPSAPLGISDFDKASFEIYPNPTSGILNVETSGFEANDFSIMITDIQGRMISNVQLNNIRTSINVRGLSPGIYQLTMMNGNEIINSKKFIKS